MQVTPIATNEALSTMPYIMFYERIASKKVITLIKVV